MTMHTDNKNALGVVNNNIARKRLKSMDMKLHCLHCRIAQNFFCHYCQTGSNNLGDYVTKQHVVIHHQAVRGNYLTPEHKLDLLQRRRYKDASAARVC